MVTTIAINLIFRFSLYSELNGENSVIEDWDTLDAVALLARCLGRSRRTLRFAGIKEMRLQGFMDKCNHDHPSAS